MKRGLVLAAAAVGLVLSTAAGRAATSSRIVFAADRAPSVSGEIYRLLPNGHRIDLSRSPYQDRDPAVSPSGKRVAFVSNRSGKEGVYEVGIGGRRLVRAGPLLAGVYGELAWQPHGRLIAFDAYDRIFIAQPRHKPVHVPGAVAGPQPWSPDGRILLTTASGEMRAISPQGHVLWTVSGSQQYSAAWSAGGLAALAVGHDAIVVYDETGHLRFKVRIARRGDTPSWSPDGSRLALIDWPTLREWTSTGRLVLQERLRNGDTGIAWAGPHRLITAHEPSRWLDPRSADGKLAIVTTPVRHAKVGSRFALGVALARGGRATRYAHVPGCWSYQAWQAAVGSLQFAGRSIVYESWQYCDGPFSNLYSMAPDGSGRHRLANVQAQETQPAVSPDGSEIAYVWAQYTGLSCAGCSDGIRIASAAGTELRTLTNPQNCTFDDSPTWSPDGSTILFSESSCDSPPELYTIPTGGGPAHDLGVAGKDPAWGPQKIAYVAGGVWEANADGTDPVRVGPGSHPAWSADGRLAYLTGPNGTTVVVGPTQTQLPFADVTSLAWSPDGTRFVVTARAQANSPADDVYTISTDGTDPVRLTKNYDASGAGWR